MTQPARDGRTRKGDALSLLTTPAIDAWGATASTSGAAHLVPLSLAWIAGEAVVAVATTSTTALNLTASGQARLAVGPTRDVVMIDAVLDRAVDVDQDDGLWAAYTAQAAWDPRQGSGYVFLVLRPRRLQAGRESNEMVGRTLLRDGTWLV